MENQIGVPNSARRSHQCNICDKFFSNNANLKKHTNVVHNIVDMSTKPIVCREKKCHRSFSFIYNLRTHLLHEHGIPMLTEKKSFKSKEEFLNWKEQTEKTDTCSFVQPNGTRRHANDSSKTSYFYCNRTGHETSKEETIRQRHKTSLGSCKIGGHCTAGLKLTENVVGDTEHTLDITFFKTHYGHEQELGYLPIPKTNRGAIAGQLLQKIPYDEILDKVRSSVNDTIDRIHLLSRKDISNIEASYGIEANVQRNSNDKLSVDLWVREMTNKEDNPVIYYKQQGDLSDILETEDFALGIMSKAQAEILKKFGSNSIICMDSTHGTNGYDFGLTTVMVVDDFGEGFPVAFFYSNRENYTALKLFCTSISHKAGLIHCDVFMSDDADQFYAAWSSAMNNVPQKLLCAWHVDRAWRGKICAIKNKEMQKSVYKTLRMVLEETDVAKFEVFLEKSVAEFLEDPDTKSFGEYFKLHYANRASTWAYCYRIGKGINTNMYLESLHKVIKHIYLKGRVVKRLDKSIHALIRLVRDKQFDRIIKLQKGKVTAKISAIHDRHKIAKSMPVDTIAQINDCEWRVPSFQKGSTHSYTIIKKNPPSGHICELTCKVCQICTHMYSCSCTDFLLKNTICKHVHLLGIKCNGEHSDINVVPEYVADHSSSFNSQSEMQVHLKTLKNPLNEFDVLQSKIVEDSQALVSKIKLLSPQTTGLETLKAIQSHFQVMNALTGINVMPVMKDVCPGHENEPSNKKIKMQDRYRSTKQKKDKGTGLRKPTTEEKKEKEKEYMV